MPVEKVDSSQLLGSEAVVMAGDSIPRSWREGLKAPRQPKERNDATMVVNLLDAALFAAQKHRNQRRKDADASPYINHPLALAQLLATMGGVNDSAVLCAALLHDAVEDTETSFEELEERFGPRIAGIVREVTDDKSLEKTERKQQQVEKAAGKTPEAKLVKLADKICNLRDILEYPPHDWSATRKLEYFQWASKVVAGLRGSNTAMEQEFDRLMEEGTHRFGEGPA